MRDPEFPSSMNRRDLLAASGFIAMASTAALIPGDGRAAPPRNMHTGLGTADGGPGLVPSHSIQSGEPLVAALQDHRFLRGAEDIHIHGSLALIPCRAGHTITTCDISDPAEPRVVASFQSPDLFEATGFAVQGSIAVVSSSISNIHRSRLLVLDVSDPRNIRQLGSVEVGGGGWMYKIEIHDGICFVTHLSDRHLYAVDVRTPSQPRVIGSVLITDADDRPFSVLLRWPHVLVGTYQGKQSRLVTVDVSDAARMKVINVLADDPDYCTFSGMVKDDVLYATSYAHSGIFAFDVKDFRKPKKIGRLVDKQIDMPNRCVVHGDRAYLPLVHGDGVAIVDIGDPANMKLVKVLYDRDLMTRTYSIALNAPHLYVGARDSDCVAVFDIRNIEASPSVRSLYE